MNQYNFDVRYNPGTSNVEADVLSRYPVLESFNNEEHIRIVNLIETDDIVAAQTDYKSNEMPKHLTYDDNRVVFRKKSGFNQIFVPPAVREKLLDEFHKTFGYLGTMQMLTLIAISYYWMSKHCGKVYINPVSAIKRYGGEG